MWNIFSQKTQEERFPIPLRSCLFALQFAACLTVAGCAKSHDGIGAANADNNQDATVTTTSKQGTEPDGQQNTNEEGREKESTSTKTNGPRDTGEGEGSLVGGQQNNLTEREQLSEENGSTPGGSDARAKSSGSHQNSTVSSDSANDDDASQSSQLSQQTIDSIRSKASAQVGGIENVETPDRDPRGYARRLLNSA